MTHHAARSARDAARRAALVGLALLLALPAALVAQQGKAKGKHGDAGADDRGPVHARGGDWWEPAAAHYRSLGWTQNREDGPVVILGELERPATTRPGKPGRGNIPSFCRTGAGHPRFGRRWCVEKGFGLGGDRGLGDLGDIILRREDRRLEERDVFDVLGDVVADRVRDVLGLDEGRRLEGRYAPAVDGGTVLQLRSAGEPVAEFADGDGDGRVEAVILSAGRATGG